MVGNCGTIKGVVEFDVGWGTDIVFDRALLGIAGQKGQRGNSGEVNHDILAQNGDIDKVFNPLGRNKCVLGSGRKGVDGLKDNLPHDRPIVDGFRIIGISRDIIIALHEIKCAREDTLGIQFFGKNDRGKDVQGDILAPIRR